MKTMQARYPGRCAKTGAQINPGDTIEFHRRGYAILVQSIEPDMDDETASAVGAYMASAMRRSVSDTFTTSGGTFYRNKRGRCEDAPCCGCCTI